MQKCIKKQQNLCIINITTKPKKLNFKCLCKKLNQTIKKRKCHRVAICCKIINNKSNLPYNINNHNEQQLKKQYFNMEVPRKRKYHKITTTIR